MIMQTNVGQARAHYSLMLDVTTPCSVGKYMVEKTSKLVLIFVGERFDRIDEQEAK